MSQGEFSKGIKKKLEPQIYGELNVTFIPSLINAMCKVRGKVGATIPYLSMTKRQICNTALIIASVFYIPLAGAQSAGSASIDASTPKKSATSNSVGSNIGNNCFACHGTDGRSPGPIPSLNNYDAKGLVQMMRAFRSGARPSTVMGRIAKAYSDAEIDATAKYINSLKGE